MPQPAAPQDEAALHVLCSAVELQRWNDTSGREPGRSTWQHAAGSFQRGGALVPPQRLIRPACAAPRRNLLRLCTQLPATPHTTHLSRHTSGNQVQPSGLRMAAPSLVTSRTASTLFCRAHQGRKSHCCLPWLAHTQSGKTPITPHPGANTQEQCL